MDGAGDTFDTDNQQWRALLVFFNNALPILKNIFCADEVDRSGRNWNEDE